MHIASVDKLPLSTTGSPLLIRCKTFLSVTFVIAKERDSHDVYSTLIKLCQPGESLILIHRREKGFSYPLIKSRVAMKSVGILKIVFLRLRLFDFPPSNSH
jgi:hypothetical protein